MKDFVHWLFADPAGHFALACIGLIACAVAWLGLSIGNYPAAALDAKVAAGLLSAVVMTKLRS